MTAQSQGCNAYGNGSEGMTQGCGSNYSSGNGWNAQQNNMSYNGCTPCNGCNNCCNGCGCGFNSCAANTCNGGNCCNGAQCQNAGNCCNGACNGNNGCNNGCCFGKGGNMCNNGKGCDGKGGLPDEPRFSGWTRNQWVNWVQTPCGQRWSYNKRYEADTIVEWMIRNWGIDWLRSGSGVIDVGGDPGFLAAACLQRGIPVTVVDPTWRLSGKESVYSQVENYDCSYLQAYQQMFDNGFCSRNEQLVRNASVIVSLYGDEATAPSMQAAAAFQRPCLVVPCNECIRFFPPPPHQTYDGYVWSCVAQGNQLGGFFEFAQLHGSPFSRALVVQSPMPSWASGVSRGPNGIEAPWGPSLSIPMKVLEEMGVLHQAMWKMELLQNSTDGMMQSATKSPAFNLQNQQEAIVATVA
eukprot:TRINITY_DN62917_c0_g1_i1.p1 TRINITY_DN62917_c0_g1~~TRINITY_DN62917_c0_g1_i1.p1  ORF type:complete len:419 (-),score=55.64 TRINITY_DN62917_c0_g1_i1:346-1572(-)